MVGLVIVSHSRRLAEALLGLTAQVCPTPIPVRVAAGAGPDHAEIGTDATQIVEAIQEVYGPDGVVVLMDLGSAILSAETALDLLPDDWRKAIRLCPAPLVEGALSAAVQIGSGQKLDAVCREACRALDAKLVQIEPEPPPPSVPPGALESLFTVTKPHGLHARPAARLVQLIAGFRAEVYFRRPKSPGSRVASGRSLTSLVTLGARQGDVIAVSTSGDDARQALDAIRDFLRAELAEEELAEPSQPQFEAGRPFGALPLSPGVAWGPAYVYDPSVPVVDESAADPDAEWTRFLKAVDVAKEAIRARAKSLAACAPAEAEIVETHLLTLEDPVILSRMRDSILASRKAAGWAWGNVIDEVIASYESLEDPYLRQRAADLRGIRTQVHQALTDKTDSRDDFARALSQPVIVIARESSPGLIAGLPRRVLLGVISVEGQPTSHGAIIARSLRIPAVSGVPASFLSLGPETVIGLDGATGQVWLNPDAEEIRELGRRKGESTTSLEARPPGPWRTRDGVRLEIAANAGSVEGARVAALEQAEAIGLLRTEFMYLNRLEPPTEQEQIATLEEIAAAMTGRPVFVRSLDVGGDKPVPFLPRLPEQNPYLGVRGIRLSLRSRTVFRHQIRAVLRAGAENDLRLMLPMVSALEDLVRSRAFIEECHRELLEENLAHRWPIPLAVMIETPSAALIAASLAPLVDFLSIGTNDLTQYTLAAERGHPQLSEYLDSLHPSVLQLIGKTVEAGHQAGKQVGVCGEIASDPVATPILLGLQVDEISIEPAAIGTISRVVSGLSAEKARDWARGVLKLATAKEVREASAAFASAV